jgi:hypothetical protein
MAENNKAQTPPKAAPITLIDPRDHFIGIALRALIEQQIATKQTGQYSVAADHAVRYANAVMESRAKSFKPTVSTGGRGVAASTVIPPAPESDISDLSKTLGELADEKPPGEGDLPPNIVPPISQREKFQEPLAELK